MKRAHKSGIYAIEHIASGRVYIGSSADIPQRWYQHRHSLDKGKHGSPHLQRAWSKYGPDAFEFYVLEECEKAVLLLREQEYLDAFLPPFNICKKAGAGPGWENWSEASKEAFRAMLRARAALITHCLHGHEYTLENTGHNGLGKAKRFCRTCNNERMNAKLAVETPEQREARNQRASAYYVANKETINAQMREYTAAHKDERRAYELTRREINRQLSAERRATETPEQRARRLEQKRVDYEKHKEQRLAAQHEAYRRNHPEPEPATACKSGHPYVEGSFRVWRGLKECKICRAASKKAYRERAKIAETPEAHAARLAKRYERERDTWRDQYQRRKERQVA